MSITRRKLFRGLATTAIGAAAVSANLLASDKSTRGETLNRLNLIFHGLFGFIMGDKIQVVTPDFDEHAFYYLERSVYKPLSKTYTLNTAGLDMSSRISRVPDALNVVLKPSDCGFTLNEAGQNGSPRCRLILPKPSAMKGLRSLDNMTSHSVWFIGGYYDKIKANKIPLVQVLSYIVTDPSQVVLQGPTSNDKWTPYPYARTSNLHLFAEPRGDVAPDHAEKAFQALATLIHGNLANLKCTLWPQTDPAPVEETGIQDLWPEDERCLQERLISTPRAGIRIVNCMSLVVQQ
jgi:hypothetical protein